MHPWYSQKNYTYYTQSQAGYAHASRLPWEAMSPGTQPPSRCPFDLFPVTTLAGPGSRESPRGMAGWRLEFREDVGTWKPPPDRQSPLEKTNPGTVAVGGETSYGEKTRRELGDV